MTTSQWLLYEAVVVLTGDFALGPSWMDSSQSWGQHPQADATEECYGQVVYFSLVKQTF